MTEVCYVARNKIKQALQRGTRERKQLDSEGTILLRFVGQRVTNISSNSVRKSICTWKIASRPTETTFSWFGPPSSRPNGTIIRHVVDTSKRDRRLVQQCFLFTMSSYVNDKRVDRQQGRRRRFMRRAERHKYWTFHRLSISGFCFARSSFMWAFS